MGQEQLPGRVVVEREAKAGVDPWSFPDPSGTETATPKLTPD